MLYYFTGILSGLNPLNFSLHILFLCSKRSFFGFIFPLQQHPTQFVGQDFKKCSHTEPCCMMQGEPTVNTEVLMYKQTSVILALFLLSPTYSQQLYLKYIALKKIIK